MYTQRRPKPPGEVRPPLTPIEAWPAGQRSIGIEPETVKQRPAARGDHPAVPAQFDPPAGDQRIGKPDPNAAGQMIVTGPPRPQHPIARSDHDFPCRARQARRKLHDALQHARHVRGRQPVIAVPALLCDRDQPDQGEPPEMAAPGCRRYPGGGGEFGGGKRAAIHQGAKYGGSGRVACASCAVQVVGSIALLLAGGTSVPLLLTGVMLFGAGIGNATSLPPLIAQTEFTRDDVARAVPLIVAIGQASYAFTPAAFGLIQAYGPADPGAPWVFIAAGVIQVLAILMFLVGQPFSQD